jgi:hypothetical protein
MRVKAITLAAAITAAISAPAMAAIYADSATTEDVIFFGSGTLTGAPDNGGAFLSNTFDPPTALGSIIWGFSGGLTTGVGTDLQLYDVANFDNELFELAVSIDGLGFTVIGVFNTLMTSFDLDSYGFTGDFSFVRVVNTSESNSPDFDAAAGYYAPAPVPLPASLPLLLAGLGSIALLRRRKAA